MPLTLEYRGERRAPDGALVVALVNNMPDAALEPTERQFASLLEAAAGPLPLRLRRIALPEVARGTLAREHIARGYFGVEDLQAEPPAALIVTGMEPKAPTLEAEPYWQRMLWLMDWAQRHTASSLWSCLAAHAAAQGLAGVRRRRLAQKCFGVFEHALLREHPLLRGIGAPLPTPHSRWNELPVEALRAAGFQILSASPDSGADLFVREGPSLLVAFQGHPEYEQETLLREYRRDVGRFLRGEQPAWPTLPRGYLGERGLTALAQYQRKAEAVRDAQLLAEFPFAVMAAELTAGWRDAAVGIYRNWLTYVSVTR